jgi:hypothetical protein
MVSNCKLKILSPRGSGTELSRVASPIMRCEAIVGSLVPYKIPRE